MATQDTIHSHNYQHFENLQMSSKEFYDLLVNMIKEYNYPGVECKTTELKETGMFSSSREYLKIQLKRLNFLVCAAPFGKSFFISWWFQEDANTGANIAGKIFGNAAAAKLESKTYYQLDTEHIFTASIQAIIKKAIEKVKADHGFRENDLQLA